MAMSIDNYDTDTDDFDNEDVDTQSQGTDIRSLRRAANSSKKLKAELDSVKRELEFAKAGLPLDDPKMRYFVKGYEGDITAEAIRQAAAEAGFLSTQRTQQEAVPEPLAQAAEAAQTRMMAASAGAGVGDSSEASALAHLEQAMAEGGVEALMEVARQYGIPTAYDT